MRSDVLPEGLEALEFNGVADRMRREMYRNIDLENLLRPAILS